MDGSVDGDARRWLRSMFLDRCFRSREAGTPSGMSHQQTRKIAAAALTVGVLSFGAVACSDDDGNDNDNPIDTVDDVVDSVEGEIGDVVDSVEGEIDDVVDSITDELDGEGG
jgi:hypothetical protein